MIGLRCRIGDNVTIRNSVLMGADFFQTPAEIAADRAQGRPPVEIGNGTLIEGAIIDKNCRIGRNVQVVNRSGVDSSQENEFGMIVDGIVMVHKEATLPDGWNL